MRRSSGSWTRVEGARWMGSRARNAMRRLPLIGAVSGGVFLTALLALVLIPREATRLALRHAPRLEDRPDTTAPATALARALAVQRAADSTLVVLRAAAHPAVPAAAPVETLPPALVARRDSLAGASAALGRLIQHAQEAPLPASWHALGESPLLAGEPRAHVLVDSLAAAERDRDAFGALGGADPVFVALTSRLAEIGHAIQDVAEARRLELRRELATLRPAAPPPVATRPLIDTLPYQQAALAAAGGVRGAQRELADTRRALAAYEQQVEASRALANVAAPPLAMLAAAFVLGLACGFAASVVAEMRRPRVADAREVESLIGVRVLMTIRPRERQPEHMRRRADQVVSSLLDPTADHYRLLYLHFAATGTRLPLVTVTGEEADLVATIGANLAAAAAYDARSTLLVDADLTTAGVAGVLRLRSGLGLAGVLARTVDWAEAIVSTAVGRDRTLDVIPAGAAAGRGFKGAHASAEQRRDLARLARRYDLTVVVAPFEHARNVAQSILPSPDVVVCARVGHTTLSRLGAIVDDLRGTGLSVHGLVLWDAEPPVVPHRSAEDRAAAAAPPVPAPVADAAPTA